MKIIATRNTKKSALATIMKGAHGAIVSKAIPPIMTNVVVPTEPKKNAIPLSVPRTVLFMLRMKTTSTARNYKSDVITRKMQSMNPCHSFGLSMNLNRAATNPRTRKAIGTITLASALSAMYPKKGSATIVATELQRIKLR